MSDDQSQGQGLKSLDTALGVLALMARYDGPRSLSDIAKDSGMPPSKVHRYLASFVNAGLVRQHGRSGQYDIGPEALKLGVTAIARSNFVNDAAEGLVDLVNATGMTALLSVLANGGATVVRWERGATPTDTASGLGTTLPLLHSATGHVFLAWAPQAAIQADVARQMRQVARTPEVNLGGPRTKAALAEMVQEIRARGYTATVGRYIPGLVAVAAPILDWQGEAQAAITLVGVDPSAAEAGSTVIDTLVTYCRKVSFADQ